MIQGSVNLELRFVDDNVFLSFYNESNDNKNIICQIKNSQLYKFLYTEEETEREDFNDDPCKKEIISIKTFLSLVKKSIQASPITCYKDLNCVCGSNGKQYLDEVWSTEFRCENCGRVTERI